MKLMPDEYTALNKLIQELEDKRKKLGKALGIAAEFGDLRENAEYESAREDFYVTNESLSRYLALRNDAEIVDPASISGKNVAIGTRVRVTDLDDLVERTYDICGYFSDPEVGRISYNSPLGHAFIGALPMEVRTLDTPTGIRYYLIEEISVPGTGDRHQSSQGNNQ